MPHSFLHPTKGWRNFARPAGANRRRKLIPAGANRRRKLIPTGYLMVRKSRAYRLNQLRWSPCRHQINS